MQLEEMLRKLNEAKKKDKEQERDRAHQLKELEDYLKA